MTTAATDDAVFAYQETFPHTITMDVLFTALDEQEPLTAAALREAVRTGVPLSDGDFQTKIAPEVYL